MFLSSIWTNWIISYKPLLYMEATGFWGFSAVKYLEQEKTDISSGSRSCLYIQTLTMRSLTHVLTSQVRLDKNNSHSGGEAMAISFVNSALCIGWCLSHRSQVCNCQLITNWQFPICNCQLTSLRSACQTSQWPPPKLYSLLLPSSATAPAKRGWDSLNLI